MLLDKLHNKKTLILTMFSLLILTLSVSVFHNRLQNKPLIMKMTYATDCSIDENLVGISHNVFVGEVIKQKNTKKLNSIPETQFEVRVIKNIKGNLQGEITVNQQGGYEDGQLYLFEEDELIKEGKTYVFATRYLPQENWHTLVPKYGRIEVKDELSKNNLEKRFEKAYKQETKFDNKFLK